MLFSKISNKISRKKMTTAGVFALLAISLLTPLTPIAPLAQSAQAQAQHSPPPSRFVIIPFSWYTGATSAYQSIPNFGDTVNSGEIREYLESIPNIESSDIKQICSFDPLYNIFQVKNYGRYVSAFKCDKGVGATVYDLGLFVVEMVNASAAQTVISEITKGGYSHLDEANLRMIARGWNLVYCYSGKDSVDVDVGYYGNSLVNGKEMWPASGAKILAILKWGTDQNPNNWTHVSFLGRSAYNVPDGYEELTEIPPQSILAVYVDIDREWRDERGNPLYVSFQC